MILPYKDKEKEKKHRHEYRLKNKKAYARRSREYYVKNREKISKQAQERRAKDPEKRAKENENKTIERRNQKTAVMAHYSKKLSNSDIPCCNCCGENQFLIFLTIDHIKGWRNSKETERRGGKRLTGKDLYHYLQKNNFPAGYQVLCMNCNSAKSDDEVCPHQRSDK